MEQVNEILEKVKKETVDTNIKHTFRLSFMYSLKAIVFLVIIIALFVLNIAKFSKKHMLQYAILVVIVVYIIYYCLLYTSPSPRDRTRSRMPSSA